MQNSRLNKIRTALAAILLAFTVFSVSFSAMEHNHECSGEDCAICYVIQVAEQNLKLLKITAAFIAILTFTSFYKNKNFTIIKNYSLNTQTLISNKIRLND